MDWQAKRQELLGQLVQASRVVGQIEGQLALCDQALAPAVAPLAPPADPPEAPKE